MPQQTAAEDTRDQCVSLPGADSSVATITSSTWSSRLQARDISGRRRAPSRPPPAVAELGETPGRTSRSPRRRCSTRWVTGSAGDVDHFAAGAGVPLLRLKKPGRSCWDDRKLDHVRPCLDQAAADGRFGVVAVVVAQEFRWVTGTRNRSPKPGVVSYDFVKEERRVSASYFYVHDREFGAGFIKICSYFPYPAKVWLNGHERAKRQAGREDLSYASLANGFAACPEPARLQAICDRFGPSDAQAFFDRWTAVIPVPFTAADRAAGYWWELSMRQVEVSRTLVFDDPRRARGFFEALVTDNVGVGRPEQTFTPKRSPMPGVLKRGASGAAGPASAPGLSLRPGLAHAGPHPLIPLIYQAHRLRRSVWHAAVFPAPGCPAPDRRSKPPGGHRLAMAFASMARHRFATERRLSRRQVRHELVAPAHPRSPPGG